MNHVQTSYNEQDNGVKTMALYRRQETLQHLERETLPTKHNEVKLPTASMMGPSYI